MVTIKGVDTCRKCGWSKPHDHKAVLTPRTKPLVTR